MKHRIEFRKVSLLLGLLLSLMLISACGGQTATQQLPDSTAAPAATSTPAAEPIATPETAPTQPETPPLTVVTSFRIKSLDPIKQGFWYSEFGCAELLMKWDRDFIVKPWVLKSLDQIDDLNWRMTLRPEVTFQNGASLDAEALAALMNRQLELSPSAQANLPGASVKVTGDYELVLTTQTPTPTLPNILASESVFPVYDVKAVEAVGEDYEKLAGAGFYTGPYQVVELDDQSLVLERYEGYWQGEPPLPGVTVKFVPDAQARILAVQNGEADIAIYVPSEAKRIVAGRSDAFFVTAPNTREGVRLVLNLKTSPFDDVAVRRAFGLGIDYASIANEVLDGVYAVATGYYPPGFPWLVENQKTDPALANQLLDEAGWLVGDDGIRVKDGQPLKIILLIYPQQPDLEPISTAMQSQLREIGFDVEIQSVDGISDTMKKDLTPWNAGLAFSGSVSGGGAPQLHRYIASDGDRNYGGIHDSELDAFIKELNVTFDAVERTELLKKIQNNIIEENAYQFFVSYKLFPAVVSPAYRDYLPSHNWLHVTYETRPTK
ncbi:MAG: ABC transporter substrate-binding protein [Chloroflexi bacterium]|nr:ABC transporter substrate-binding protein [Chloroflexota bacterium]